MKTNKFNNKNYNFNKDNFVKNNDLCINILINLSKWQYYQTVVKNHTLSKYDLLFGEIDSSINEFRNLNIEIDLLIHSFILSVGNKNKQHSKKSHLYSKIIHNNPSNVNILLNNILLKFENLKNHNFSENKSLENENSIKFEKEISILFKNLVKNIHPDLNKFDYSKLKMSNGTKLNMSANDIFVIVKFFESEADIKRLTALDFVINQIKNKKSLNLKNIGLKLQFLDNWLNKENEKFINQEPYCYYNNLNDPKWIENKSKTLQHKLVLEERRFETQRNLLNRISNLTL